MSTVPNSATRPVTVTAAFWLWVVSAVVGVIGAIVAFATIGNNPQIQQLEQTEAAAVTTGVTIAAVLFLVFAALRVLFAWFMYKGRNWARIVLTILAALSIIGVLLSLGTATILEWVTMLLVLVALVLMWVPQSNAYFAASRRPRA